MQAAVEQALLKVTGQAVRLIGAARTDTGVHASGQVIAFDVAWRHPDETLIRALNATLPEDIAFQRLERAERTFHPRFDAYSRVYRYQVYEAPARNPLYLRTAWQRCGSLDAEMMNAVAAELLGEHDFATFGAPTQGDSTIRRVYRSVWQIEALKTGVRLLTYHIEANGFLHHMVRVLVGALADVGSGKWSVVEFTDALQAADRSRARQMAPPHGLTLIQVKYGGEDAPLLDNGDR